MQLRECLLALVSYWMIGWAMSHPHVTKADALHTPEAKLELRNFYMNRDFREGHGPSKREEWAQGFLLHLDSGFTEGTVGVGAQALGMYGVKLDSGPGRVGTGLLPVHDTGRAADEYAKLALSGKLKYNATYLSIGELLVPTLPTIRPNDGRLFPQTFEGGMLSVRDIDRLTLTAGRLSKVRQRNSTDQADLTLSLLNRRFSGHGASADHFDFFGLDYQASDKLLLRYHGAQLDDVYRQHVLTLTHSGRLGPGAWNTDLRYSRQDDYGSAKGGTVNNRALQGLLGYTLRGHQLGLTYQQMLGETGYAYVHGTDPNLINLSILGEFANAKERSWALRYGYDFAHLGIPGLQAGSRYISGERARITGTSRRGREWEVDNEVRYTLQSGPAKDLSIRLRQATYRSNYARNFPRDTDDWRIQITYTWALH